ncbi:MAG: ABC transporter permease, partial [Anaerolineae bacterium]
AGQRQAQLAHRLALFLGVWQVAAGRVDARFLLPGPAEVAASLAVHHRQLLFHSLITLTEVSLGFLAGGLSAGVVGYVIYRSRPLEGILMPYVVASQAVPVVAVAPLLVVWFGAGAPVKVATAALVAFFPMLVSTVVGFRNIDPAYRDLMRAHSATATQTLLLLEIPAALPVLLGGMRVGVTLAVIGAVVGEFLGSDRGLGALILVARGQYNTPLLFAATLVLVAVALALYGATALLERAVLAGRRRVTTVV